MGEERLLFSHALEHVAVLRGIRIRAISSCYRTEPQGDVSQPWFVNQAAALVCEAHITPQALLRAMLRIEEDFGRIRDSSRRFGPRRIDIDLLLFSGQIVQTDFLTLPHPRMFERAFVLVPLFEIAPKLVLPDGKTLDALLNRLVYRQDGKVIYQK